MKEFYVCEILVYCVFFICHNVIMPSVKKSGLAAPGGCGVSVKRDTPRLVPLHSTLKPFFSKTRFWRVRHWYSEGAIRLSSSLRAFIREASGLSLSLSFSLVDPRFGSTKSPPCAHAPCPANNDDETPRCASSSATGRTEREVSTCPVTLALAASPVAYRSHENKQSCCSRRVGAVYDPRESSFRFLSCSFFVFIPLPLKQKM